MKDDGLFTRLWWILVYSDYARCVSIAAYNEEKLNEKRGKGEGQREKDLQLEQGAPSSNTVHLTLRLRHLYRVFRERKREEGGTQEKSTIQNQFRLSPDFPSTLRFPSSPPPF